MNNPFEVIETRLSTIENLLLDLKHQLAKKAKKNSDQFLTVKEASVFLNLAVPTLYSKVSKKELPFMKRSRRLYFSRIELIEYLKKGRNKTAQELEKEASHYELNANKRS